VPFSAHAPLTESSIFFRRIVGVMSMRVNSTCAHQLQSHEVDDTDRAPVTMDGDARGE
jgi:hypothetical protein